MWTEAKAHEVLGEVMKKAATDPQYRQLALTNPEAAIAKVDSTPIPTGFKIRFVENKGANLTLVLPDPIATEGELSDAELEQVAGGGGRCGGSCAASCVISSLV